MEIKKIIILISFVAYLHSYPLNYKIKYFGINIADCMISSVDTSFNNNDSKKIIYTVKTKAFFKKLFPVDNTYQIILNDKNEILFFSKKTFQPKVENFIETNIINGYVQYKNTDIKIPSNSYNIFSLLYCIMEGIIPENFILEKEGQLYESNLDLIDNNTYSLEIPESDKINEQLLIKNTDIFTWGIFMPDAKRRLIIDENTGFIKKCIFTKGITTIKAELIIN